MTQATDPQSPAESQPSRYGMWIARHARLVVIAWLVGIVLAFGGSLGAFGGGGLFGHLHQDEPYVPSESNTGNKHLVSGPNAGGNVIIRFDGVSRDKQATVGPAIQRALTTGRDVSHVESAFSPAARAHPQAGAPYRSATAPNSLVYVVTLHSGVEKPQQEADVDLLVAAGQRAAGKGVTMRNGGEIPLLKGITGQVETDLRTGESVALPLTLIVMIVVFGGFVAAGIPLVGAVASIAGGLLSLFGFTHVMNLDATVVNIVTVLGLGLSIDYGLLIVSRFREEAAAVLEERPRTALDIATARTLSTAGRTVAFSGLTVAISVLGLVLLPASVTRAVGIAAFSVVLVAVSSALTLVPACCRLAGGRLIRRKAPRAAADLDSGRFARLAHLVQRHVTVSIALVAAVLLLFASPLLGLRQVSSSSNLLPKHASQRVFMDDLARDFPATSEPAVQVVARTSVQEATQWAQTDGAHRPGVTGVNPVAALGDGYVAVGLRDSHATVANGQAARLVHDLRAHRPPFPTWITGQEAKLLDYTHALRQAAPWSIGIVALATIVLLFFMTGSLVLPLKALLFNGLSLAASLGALTWIFQGGHLENLFGYSSNSAMESVVPVILIAFGFGLAMDYEVFLLSRIVEAHAAGDSDRDAVARGIQRSGGIVTAAALLMVIVMLGISAAKVIIVKEMGIGLALSIALDATLVRMVLVPATMTLMGRWNWWAPGFMRRLHERFSLAH